MATETSSVAKRAAPGVYASAEGYDLVAEYYDSWAWQEFWRRNEFPIVLSRLIEASPGHAILDVGAGTGAFLSYAAPHLPAKLHIVGLDISTRMLRQAFMRIGTRVDLLRADVQSGLPFPENYFDVVLMMRVANHLKKLDTAILEISRVLSPAGLLLATDLADDYDYTCTRIPTPQNKIAIETYKHPHAEWRRTLELNFSSVKIREYSLAQLDNLPAVWKTLPQNVPLFKFIVAQKR
jgi:ubiquinone/menaquinone biosynthesis C-methylase UbiE